MAISNYPSPDSSGFSKVFYVAPSSSTTKVVFTSLRTGIYKPIQTASMKSTASQNGMEVLNVQYDPESNAGFTYGYIEDSSNQQLTVPGYSSLDYYSHSEGQYAYSNGINFIIPSNGSKLTLTMQTYRPVVKTQSGVVGTPYVRRLPLIVGNTMLTYTRNETRPTQGVSNLFQYLYRFGTNTTTFTTSIPSATMIDILSGSGFTSGYVCQVVYEASETNKWVIVGAYSADTNYSDSRPMIYSSTDAVTWTSRTTPGTFFNNASNYYTGLHNVIYSGGSYYASGTVCSTTTPSITYNSRVYTSTDGATWSQTYSTTTVLGANLRNLCSAPTATEKFAIYNQNSGYLMTSTDAVTWTDRTSVVITAFQNLSAINNRYFVWYRNATEADELKTSTDGITWTIATLKHSYGIEVGPMQYNAGYYWASEFSGIYISTNGTLFEFFPARGLKDSSTNTDTAGWHPVGYQPAYDGTTYGWVRSPQTLDTSTPQTSYLFYSTGTLAQYLYGATHPDRQYVYALSEPSNVTAL